MAGDGLSRRKSEHIDLALDRRMQGEERYFDRLRLVHRALPEISMDDVSTVSELAGKPLAVPLIITAMTGGTDQAGEINRNLAAAAERVGAALGLGSQRAAIEDPALASTYQVRDAAPSVPIIANLGLVQLNYGYGLDECRRAVEMVDADVLAFHVNALQEAIQPEGQTDFSNLVEKVAPIVEGLPVPVMIKEIGHGLDRHSVEGLYEAGVRMFDVAGSGGTDWARIEAQRARDRELGEVFSSWGTPTPTAISALATIEGLQLVGSGGVRTGLDGAKALALGAEWAGAAQPFLAPAMESAEAAAEEAERWIRELRIAMFCSGARTVEELKQVEVVAL